MMFNYVGKSIEVKYETGYHFRIDYLSNTKMKWTSLVERTDGRPMVGEETYYLNEQADNIFTVTWIEETGVTVAQNLDFNKMIVYAFMTWPDETGRGNRAFLAHHGTIKFL